MTSILDFKPVPNTRDRYALPYALTVEEQQAVGETLPAIQDILNGFRILSKGYQGVLAFYPEDTEELDVALQPDPASMETVIGKRVVHTPDNTQDTGSGRPKDAWNHDYTEFGRWLTAFYLFVQENQDFAGVLALTIYEAEDTNQSEPLSSIAWFISSEGIEMLRSHSAQ